MSPLAGALYGRPRSDCSSAEEMLQTRDAPESECKWIVAASLQCGSIQQHAVCHQLQHFQIGKTTCHA